MLSDSKCGRRDGSIDYLKLIKLAVELNNKVNRQEWITSVMFVDSHLPPPLVCRWLSGRHLWEKLGGRWKRCETRTWTKPETEKRGPALEHRATTDTRWGPFYSAARSFLGFVLSALPSPPADTPGPLDGAPHDLCPARANALYFLPEALHLRERSLKVVCLIQMNLKQIWSFIWILLSLEDSYENTWRLLRAAARVLLRHVPIHEWKRPPQ